MLDAFRLCCGDAHFCCGPDQVMTLQAEGTNGFKDPNILAHHMHGFFGNPGTDNVPCDSNLVDPSLICYRGDNVFADVIPGECKDWQYDIPLDHPVGMLW